MGTEEVVAKRKRFQRNAPSSEVPRANPWPILLRCFSYDIPKTRRVRNYAPPALSFQIRGLQSEE